VGVRVGVGVSVRVGTIVEVRIGTGVLVSVGMRTIVGVGVTVGETVGDAVRVSKIPRVGVLVGVRVGVEVGKIPLTKEIPAVVGVGVLVEGVVHQGAVKEKPSRFQVRPLPPVQVVWKTSIWRPGWNSVPCPRSSGGGANLFVGPTGMETAKVFGL
jgi:hypothetical protein